MINGRSQPSAAAPPPVTTLTYSKPSPLRPWLIPLAFLVESRHFANVPSHAWLMNMHDLLILFYEYLNFRSKKQQGARGFS